MDVRVIRAGHALVLSGRLGAATVADMRAVIGAEIDAGTGDLRIDLSDVELVDATGLGMLVGAHRRADRQGRRLVLHAVPERLERLLLATRLHRVLIVERAPLQDVIVLDQPISA